MFERRESGLVGCVELLPRVHRDARGAFVKVMNSDAFTQLGLSFDFKELFYSTSTKGVLRGLHFQVPPHDQAKLIYCTEGEIFDVAVDLRAGSPTYGKHASFDLSAARANIVYIPSGFAHGFLVRSEQATMIYSVTSTYAPEHDTGIRWNSAGVAWPANDPFISERDSKLPALADYKTPFKFEGAK